MRINQVEWDLVIIGGGASGAGSALDAASRGLKTLLIEKHDFGKGTSSKSTKLIHGGVRYLEQGNLSLVYEALHERSILKKNAPHLVSTLQFVLPVYRLWKGYYFWIGLKLYDWLSGRSSLGSSSFLSRDATINLLPNINQQGLKKGVLYYDGQFDDTRLLISILRTAEQQGATILNYHEFKGFVKANGKITGVKIQDSLSGDAYEVKAKSIVNATGVFSDSIRRVDNTDVPKMMFGSQGIHIVLESNFLSGETAILIPDTRDDRVLFAVPWNGKVLVGTTDTKVDSYDIEPQFLEEEIDYLLEHISKYLSIKPQKEDILSVFSGLRPLVSKSVKGDPSKISRKHYIERSSSGLVSIMGGKWTTYRRMAEGTIDVVCRDLGLKNKSKTEQIKLFDNSVEQSELIASKQEYQEFVSEKYSLTHGFVVYAIRFEKAQSIEDVLARRSRLLFLDTIEAVRISPIVAQILSNELSKDEAWVQKQLTEFKELAKKYYN